MSRTRRSTFAAEQLPRSGLSDGLRNVSFGLESSESHNPLVFSKAANCLAYVLLAVLVLAAVHSTCALSISPAKKLIDMPGIHEFTVTARYEGEAGGVAIRAEGDLAKYVAFTKTDAAFTQDVIFQGTIAIPDNITPGDHEQHLVISLTPEDSGTMTAAVEIASVLVVRKLFTGPYLIADLHAEPDNGVLDTTNVYIGLENRGSEATTPVVTLIHDSGEQQVLTQLVAPASSVRLNTQLKGRGEQQVTLVVTGSNEISKEYTISIGHPVITDLRATATPDASNIVPITVHAEVDWNKPVSGVVLVDGKAYPVKIDRTLDVTYYAESNASSAKVELKLGAQTQSIDVPFKTSVSGSDPMHRSLRWEWIALVIVLAVLAFFLYRKRITTG